MNSSLLLAASRIETIQAVGEDIVKALLYIAGAWALIWYMFRRKKP